MKFFVIIVVCVALVGELVQAARSNSQEWMLFKSKHGKSYDSQAEDARRFANFMAAKQRVERHNARGDSSFKMELNHFADWTQEELSKMNGLKVNNRRSIITQDDEAYLAKILGSSNEPVPDEVDWRKVPGRVSPVKDQKWCLSQYAFAAVGALEGQEIGRVINGTSQVVQLSEQQLVECSEWNHGCYGGDLGRAFNDISELGGIMSQEDYPYTAKVGKCAFKMEKAVMSVTGHVWLNITETKLEEMLAKFGPIPAGMWATQSLIPYKSGVFTDDFCPNWLINHFVLLVGYGTDPKLGDYWIIKNSWGPEWGENGYFRIKRGVDMCGITRSCDIPKF